MSTPSKNTPRTGTNLGARRRLAVEVRRQMAFYADALQPHINNAVLAEQSLTRAMETLLELNELHSASQRGRE